MGAACGGEPEDPTVVIDKVLIFKDKQHSQAEPGQKTHALVRTDRELGINYLSVGAFLECARKHCDENGCVDTEKMMNEIA